MCLQYVDFLGWRDVINQTSYVDVSVDGTTTVTTTTTTTIGSTTSIPLLESQATTLMPTSQAVSQGEESSDTTSMFSTSMVPPRPTTPSGQEEELITTVAPTIKEEEEDEDADVEGVESQITTESDTIEPDDESDDQSVIEISTIQPDVPMPGTSVHTEPMFVEGKTDETIMDTAKLNELSSEDMLSSSEPTDSTTGLHSTTPIPEYEGSDDVIQTNIAVEGIPPTQPLDEELPSSTLDTTSIEGTTVPTASTYMCNTQPGTEMEMRSSGPAEASRTTTPPEDLTERKDQASTTHIIDSGRLDEDATSSISVIGESTLHMLEHSTETLTEDDLTTEIGSEFFTSPPMASSVAVTRPPSTVVSTQSVPGTTALPFTSSGKTCRQILKLLQLCLKHFIFNAVITTQVCKQI